MTIFTSEKIEEFKVEAFSTFKDGKRKYQQAAAYILMLNTGLRTGGLLGLLNSDINLEKKVLTVRQGVKEVYKRNGANAESGREIKVGKPKSITSKRTVPLNRTAVEGQILPLWLTGTEATPNRSICERDFTEYRKRRALSRKG